MNSFQFGESDRPLYGVYHAPQVPDAGSGDFAATGHKAVLLCPPIAQEYIRTHWIYRQLAQSLTHAGFHVLRFDYSCMGDSYGETREASLAEWLKDVQAAAHELLEVSGAQEFAVVGLRFGAAIAVLAHLKQELVATTQIVLWDPVVAGSVYLEELKALHEEMALTRPVPPKSDETLLGFIFTEELRAEISKVDLVQSLGQLIERTGAPKITVVRSEEGSGFAECERLGISTVIVNDLGRWTELCEAHDALLAPDNVQAVLKALTS